MAFSKDGTVLTLLDEDGMWRAWRVENGEPLQTGMVGNQVNHAVSFDTENSRWLLAGNAGLIWLDTEPSWVLSHQLGNGGPDSPIRDRVNALAFSPDGKWLASGGGEPSRNGEIILWNAKDGILLHDLNRIHSDTVLGLEFSPDGWLLASASSDKFAKIMDCQTWEVLKSLEGHTHHVMDVSWKTDGRLIATSGADKMIKTWDYPHGNRKKNVEGFDKEVTTVRFAGTTDQFITSSGDASLRLMDSQGKEIKRFGKIDDFQQSAAISSDGNLIASGGEDGVLRIYEAEKTEASIIFSSP